MSARNSQTSALIAFFDDYEGSSLRLTNRERDCILAALRAQSNGPADRDAVLEEAAQEIEVRGMIYGAEAAKAIRALKNAAPQTPEWKSCGHCFDDDCKPLNTCLRQNPADRPARASSEAGADGVVISRSLAERTEAIFRSVDPTGQLAVEWKRALSAALTKGAGK